MGIPVVVALDYDGSGRKNGDQISAVKAVGRWAAPWSGVSALKGPG